MRRARVFISCGQQNSREKKIGFEVERFFKDKGFETYFAERVHSPEALTEHIFKFLRRSEYFVFIDFRRNKISREEYRGSLFVNQEIAISTFLDIPALGFSEKYVKREGILNFQIYNAFPFEDGTEIISKLREHTLDWNPDSVNELHLSFDSKNNSKNIALNNYPNKPLTDWWHIEVKNRNKVKHAISCLAYLTKIENKETGEILEIPSIELIWSGLGDHTVNILADGKRDFDAFYVIHNDNVIRFQSRALTTNLPRFQLPKLTNGTYMLEYSIISSNFEIASRQFLLKFNGSTKEIEFMPQ